MQEEAERKAKASRVKATEMISGFAGSNTQKGRVALGASPTHMDYDAFREFLAGRYLQLPVSVQANRLKVLQSGLLPIHRPRLKRRLLPNTRTLVAA